MWYNESMLMITVLALFSLGIVFGQFLVSGRDRSFAENVLESLSEIFLVVVFAAVLYWGWGFQYPSKGPCVSPATVQTATK
jgi:hypothetical protein